MSCSETSLQLFVTLAHSFHSQAGAHEAAEFPVPWLPNSGLYMCSRAVMISLAVDKPSRINPFTAFAPFENTLMYTNFVYLRNHEATRSMYSTLPQPAKPSPGATSASNAASLHRLAPSLAPAFAVAEAAS